MDWPADFVLRMAIIFCSIRPPFLCVAAICGSLVVGSFFFLRPAVFGKACFLQDVFMIFRNSNLLLSLLPIALVALSGQVQ